MTIQVDKPQVIEFFRKTIKNQINEKELSWINQQENKIRTDFRLSAFYVAFSSTARFVENKKLHFSEEEIEEGQSLREGFNPYEWSLVQFVRGYLLLLLSEKDLETFDDGLKKLYETADIDEQVTIYKMLPLLPFHEQMINRATEGIRTNMSDVFDSIALDNPFPSDFLNQDAWNQMVLKAVFMQRPLYKIHGSDKRANAELAQMLLDFAHERWAANRSVTPELWRFVGPYLTENQMSDIQRAINGTSLEKQAGLLACSHSSHPAAHKLLDEYPEFKKRIKAGELNWFEIGKRNQNLAQ